MSAAASNGNTTTAKTVKISTSINNAELREAFKAAMDSYKKLPDQPSNYHHYEPDGIPTSIFAFAGSHNMNDWVINSEFRQCTVSDAEMLQPHFSGLRGAVHTGWARRLANIVADSQFLSELDAAILNGRRVIFTGHSLGGAVATLAALMLLNREKNGGKVKNRVNMACCTFAAPLIGDAHLGAAVTANGWAENFLHIVWRHDIVPRLLLSPGTLLPKTGGIMKDGAARGLRTFLRVVSERQARDIPASSSRASGLGQGTAVANRATGTEEVSAEDQAAMSELAADVVAGCQAEASAMRGSVSGTGKRGISGRIMQIGGAAHGAWQMVMGITHALGGLRDGVLDSGTYRPFGAYLLHTSTGSLMCRKPNEVLQMLYLTMVTQSGAVDTRALDIVDEHMGHRYQMAVDSIVAVDALVQPKWQCLEALISDTTSLFQLGMLTVAQDVLQAQSTMMTILRENYQRPPRWYEREQAWLAAQDAMDLVYDYRRRHLEAGIDYCEAFKAHKHREDGDVERARRVLRVFWDVTLGMYSAEDLPPSFFERSEAWLTRAKKYLELVEPIEIANYYRCGLWKDWKKGQRHYLEGGNRPARYIFIELQFGQQYPEEKLAPVLDRARREADAIDRAEHAAIQKLQSLHELTG